MCQVGRPSESFVLDRRLPGLQMIERVGDLAAIVHEQPTSFSLLIGYAYRVALRKAIRSLLFGSLRFQVEKQFETRFVLSEVSMRSELVYTAGLRVANRFLLSTLTIKAVRRLHVTNTRVEETTNQVFSDVANGNYLQVTLPEVKPVPAVDSTLISPAV